MLNVLELTVNHLREAIGLDEAPRFSWKTEADGRGYIQDGYRLQIAADDKFAAPIYDSQWTPSTHSINVEASGFAMAPARAYFARVAVSGRGERSGWSAPLRFISGLCGTPWTAEYVTAEEPPCPESSKGTWVRGGFNVSGEVSEAYLYCSALGIYVPYINGRRVGDDLLAPGWTSYNRHGLYQGYDVTACLRQGENALGAMLGAGWYKGLMGVFKDRNIYGERTAFLAQLVIRYADGSEQLAVSDESWLGGDSPVLYSEIYHGEVYDARLEDAHWCEPGAAPANGRPVRALEGNIAALEAQPGCRVRCQCKVPAARLLITPRGERVVDFGQVLTGWPEFRLRGEAGHTYMLKCFEVLDADGNVYTANLRSARQELKYTCSGTAEISYHPEFTYYGFRYIQLVDWPLDATADDFTAWVIHSDMELTGSFECSEPLLNQLHHNILWGMKGNFLDVPTDCPQRDERLGWTGDAQIFCRTATCLMDVYSFFRKWLTDMRADQLTDGGVPHIIPDIFTCSPGARNDWLVGQGLDSAAGWADAITIIPWTLYLAYGDRQVIEEQYEPMRRWIHFMRAHSEDYIWSYALQFGDWVALDAEEGSYFGATPTELCCTAYYAYSVDLFVRMARVLGRDEDVRSYGELHSAIVDKFRKTFFTPEGDMTAQTQTAHILALRFDLVAPELRARTAANLVKLLEKEGGHLVTGFMGTTYFTQVLADAGYVDEAYDLLLKDDFPSWLYQVKAGATTIWEHWDGIRPDGSMWSPAMNSFNHYAYGAVGEFLYRFVAGLDADPEDPGYHHIRLHPRISSRLRRVRASEGTPYGELKCGWEIVGDEVQLNVTVPANTHATLTLDGISRIGRDDGVAFMPVGASVTAELGSGTYSFAVVRSGEQS